MNKNRLAILIFIPIAIFLFLYYAKYTIPVGYVAVKILGYIVGAVIGIIFIVVCFIELFIPIYKEIKKWLYTKNPKKKKV